MNEKQRKQMKFFKKQKWKALSKDQINQKGEYQGKIRFRKYYIHILATKKKTNKQT